MCRSVPRVSPLNEFLGSHHLEFSCETLFRFCLLLFPIFLVTVEHWASGGYSILFLLAVFCLWRTRRHGTPLYPPERVLIGILLIYFAVFLASSAVNGWGQPAVYALGTELRFPAAIVLYLAIRRIKNSHKPLLAGIVAGVVVAGLNGLFDVYIMDRPHAMGHYDRLFFGPVLTLLLFLLYPAASPLRLTSRKAVIGLCTIAILALAGIALSKARMAYLTLVALLPLLSFYALAWRKAIVVVGIMAALGMWSYSNIDFIHDRVITAYKGAIAYRDALRDNQSLPRISSKDPVSLRLEMWRATKFFVADSPILGVGRFNYESRIRELAAQGLVNQFAADHSHPHNAYLAILDEKGFLGLTSLLALLLYPGWFAFQTRRFSRSSAAAVLILIGAYAFFSVTEASPFIKGNYVAIYLVFLSVFFAWHVRSVRSRSTPLHAHPSKE